MICSTLTGKMSLKHPVINKFCREDGMILNRIRSRSKAVAYTAGYSHHSGYKFIRINGKSYAVHRLIAQAFIPNPLNKPFVDHIDRNRSNNSTSNLRWATSKENNDNSSSVINRNQMITVRQCDNKNEYIRQLCASHDYYELNMRKPTGEWTSSRWIPKWLYEKIKNLNGYQRYEEYIYWKKNRKE